MTSSESAILTCEQCRGTGWKDSEFQCEYCNGTGQIETEIEFIVDDSLAELGREEV